MRRHTKANRATLRNFNALRAQGRTKALHEEVELAMAPIAQKFRLERGFRSHIRLIPKGIMWAVAFSSTMRLVWTLVLGVLDLPGLTDRPRRMIVR